MHYLKSIYRNRIGGTYIVTSNPDETCYEGIQLRLGEMSVLLTQKGLTDLLDVINSSREGCDCKDCNAKNHLRLIKCETTYATIHLKTTPQNINALEELIQGTLFELAMDDLLSINEIR